MRVRDHAFPLLLQKNAGEFPIVYVARIGKSHRGELHRPMPDVPLTLKPPACRCRHPALRCLVALCKSLGRRGFREKGDDHSAKTAADKRG